jgi:hypothetical protein
LCYRLKCGLFLYRDDISHNLTINVSDDGLLHENMPVILEVFLCLGFLYRHRFGNCISVIRYKYSYPVDHLLIPALSECCMLVATFINDDGNRFYITFRLEGAKMVTDVHKVNFINYKCSETRYIEYVDPTRMKEVKICVYYIARNS